jgi:hypothetical protein
MVHGSWFMVHGSWFMARGTDRAILKYPTTMNHELGTMNRELLPPSLLNKTSR